MEEIVFMILGAAICSITAWVIIMRQIKKKEKNDKQN